MSTSLPDIIKVIKSERYQYFNELQTLISTRDFAEFKSLKNYLDFHQQFNKSLIDIISTIDIILNFSSNEICQWEIFGNAIRFLFNKNEHYKKQMIASILKSTINRTQLYFIKYFLYPDIINYDQFFTLFYHRFYKGFTEMYSYYYNSDNMCSMNDFFNLSDVLIRSQTCFSILYQKASRACYSNYFHSNYLDTNQNVKYDRDFAQEFDAFWELRKNDFKGLKEVQVLNGFRERLSTAIRNDDVSFLKEASLNSDFNVNEVMLTSPFELFYDVKAISIIGYTALCGSINCFRFLYLNGAYSGDCMKAAIRGGNNEIIRILSQRGDILMTSEHVSTAIKYYRFTVAEWIINTKGMDVCSFANEILSFNALNLISMLADANYIFDIPTSNTFLLSLFRFVPFDDIPKDDYFFGLEPIFPEDGIKDRYKPFVTNVHIENMSLRPYSLKVFLDYVKENDVKLDYVEAPFNIAEKESYQVLLDSGLFLSKYLFLKCSNRSILKEIFYHPNFEPYRNETLDDREAICEMMKSELIEVVEIVKAERPAECDFYFAFLINYAGWFKKGMKILKEDYDENKEYKKYKIANKKDNMAGDNIAEDVNCHCRIC